MIEAEVSTYLKIAANTQVFRPKELEILREVLVKCQADCGSEYSIINDFDNVLKGFIIFGRTPLTDFSWDIYWLAVDKEYQGRGSGRKLLSAFEARIIRQTRPAIIRAETSSKNEYICARNFYLKQGFSEAGRIADFYSSDDDLVIYCKKIF